MEDFRHATSDIRYEVGNGFVPLQYLICDTNWVVIEIIIIKINYNVSVRMPCPA